MRSFRLAANVICILHWTGAALGAEVPAPAAQDSSKVTLSNPLAAQLLERLSATVDRPLFSPSRRPPPRLGDQVPAPSVPPAPPPNLVLSGIVMDGQNAHAVVRVGADNRIIHAQIGDNIDGWTVSQIEGRKLVLSLDGRFATFTLFSREVDQKKSGEGTASKASDNAANAPQQLPLQQPKLPNQDSRIQRRPGRMGE